MKKPHGTSLRDILREIPDPPAASAVPDAAISGIAIDSRAVRPGDLFVALRGRETDGHKFIPDAVGRGASAVIGDEDLSNVASPYVRLADARESLSWIAAAYHGWPGRRLRVIGVTGTDGKTTTAHLIHAILREAGHKAGLISSVSAVIGDERLDTGLHVTTPDAHDLQRFLADMVALGATHAVLETTSHGWSQHRADACEFDIGVFTNVTHEHLDEHGSFEAYLQAKARLIAGLAATQDKPFGNPRLAVLNRDDASYPYLASVPAANQVSYGLSEHADVRAAQVFVGEGIGFQTESKDFRVAIHSALEGIYNVHNCLAALCATVLGSGVSPEAAASGIESMRGVPGRMERIEMGQAFTAVVDFAHTPNALRAALISARRLAGETDRGGRVIAVFGAAGLRDRLKRRLMAEVAAELADLVVLTAEDPRTESLQLILEEMAAGMSVGSKREGETFWRIPDRGEAVRFAIRRAREGDVVMACGKGHEQSMCFGHVEHPWDDRTAVRAAISERLGNPGPPMPYLPTRDRSEADWLN
jgi:UDP-N-acetylmuramoyl-L-alanyl-D-glutamate--2,6-diaminopimelate ligase